MNTVEVRCPVGPRKLFTKLKLGEETGGYLPNGLIEFTCQDCSKRIGRSLSSKVRVYHRFNFLGELVVTQVEDLAECTSALE